MPPGVLRLVTSGGGMLHHSTLQPAVENKLEELRTRIFFKHPRFSNGVSSRVLVRLSSRRNHNVSTS